MRLIIKEFLKSKIIKTKLVSANSLVQNINKDYTKNQKTVLISYITENYNISLCNQPIYHTNIMECQQIVNAFVKKNYVVDICNCIDKNALQIVREKKYDVIFGLGDVFFEVCNNNKEALKIIYATENPPEVSKERELERIEYYYERHGKRVALNRSGAYYREEHFSIADYCITVGETSLYKERDFKTFRVFPIGFINENFRLNRKQGSKKNFLWFGSRGVVHKGLDILTDIFLKRQDINLYICGMNEEEEKLISYRDNIINLGRVDVNSEEFIELSNKCDFVILPSCSEGISTGVLTCMNHGLIPIVQKDTGFNELDNIAYILEDYKIEYIENIINGLIKISDDEIDEKRKKILHYSRQKFNISEFSKEIEVVLDDIIQNSKTKNA